MTAEIRNCEFRFKCPRTWDSLSATGDPSLRSCDECKRTVRYCRTPDELHAAIVKNECVAVELRSPDHPKERVLLGDPIEPEYSV